MKPEEFISFEDGMPLKKKWIVVTNNIEARDAHGQMSHVWLTRTIIKSKMDGIMTFDDAYRKIINLTHYKYV